ncbi:MAG: DNA gyrase subunit A [Oscillospiraceae bacterium]|nr:DNA gyrase subunit A [Oscillospiraceae bacterium]
MSEEINTTNSKLIDVEIEKEMQKSFLDYSMSVIVSRALPDVRDGLKPVHRRILYTMFENSLTPERPYRKCADTVGAVLARYHPHGDAAAYDAMVRLAQSFSMRYILVDGHGNFGSIDGDPAAAYRYTESKMSKISMEMLRDIDKDTVDFAPNYDDRLKEPKVLPSRFPNLLVNGSSGIAVGMATNIPPHNLGEVISAVCYFLENPEAELENIMEHISGPDFPTGAMIMGKNGIYEAYSTGRGKITVRARTEIVEGKDKRSRIVVTELPYQVNKAKLCENIAHLIRDKKVVGISNIEDHSDRNGMHIEITVSRDASAKLVLNQLYSYTQLQTTFGVILLAIVDGEPKVLNLKDILGFYIKFQIQIITKRTQHSLKKVKERAHILEGLKIALDFLDEVIAMLRSSKSIPEGKKKLINRFDLDEIQAQAIVSMRLGQLTNLERSKIEEDLKMLIKKIEELEEILKDETKKFAILKSELLDIKTKFSDKRRTKIVAVSGEVNIEELIPNENCVLTLTRFGYVKRLNVDTYKTQKRGGRGVSGMTTREADFACDMFVINSHDFVLFFTNAGRVYKLKCYEIPEGSRTSKGANIANFLPVSSEEKITSIIRVEKFRNDRFLVMVTKKGFIKRTVLNDFESIRKVGKIALTLDKEDELSWVRMTDGTKEMIIATKKGMAIKFSEADVRVMGRAARGVRALRLKKEDDCVVGMSDANESMLVLTVCETGFGRLSKPGDYRLQSRGGSGVINYNTKRFGDVVAVKMVNSQDDVIIISLGGTIIRIPIKSISVFARPSKGVRVMKVNNGDKVVTFASVPVKEIEGK